MTFYKIIKDIKITTERFKKKKKIKKKKKKKKKLIKYKIIKR